MPRADREYQRRALREELLRCGLSADKLDQEVSYFSKDNLTSTDVFCICELLEQQRQEREESARELLNVRRERQQLEIALEREKRLRQMIVEGMKRVVEEAESPRSSAVEGFQNFLSREYEEALVEFRRWLEQSPCARSCARCSRGGSVTEGLPSDRAFENHSLPNGNSITNASCVEEDDDDW
jgi:hypothetical protein